MSEECLDYYRKRARTERRLAEAADREEVALIHVELALLYEALIEVPELRTQPFNNSQ